MGCGSASAGAGVSALGAAVTTYTNKQRLLTRGPNGLTLTKAGRDRLVELEAAVVR